MQQYKANDQLLYDRFVGAPTDTMVDKKATLEKMEKKFSSKLLWVKHQLMILINL